MQFSTAKNPEDPYNKILKILDMRSISPREHEIEIWSSFETKKPKTKKFLPFHIRESPTPINIPTSNLAQINIYGCQYMGAAAYRWTLMNSTDLHSTESVNIHDRRCVHGYLYRCKETHGWTWKPTNVFGQQEFRNTWYLWITMLAVVLFMTFRFD